MAEPNADAAEERPERLPPERLRRAAVFQAPDTATAIAARAVEPPSAYPRAAEAIRP